MKNSLKQALVLNLAWLAGIAPIPLVAENGTLGVLVAAHKEARAGTEPFAANDIRLLELFAVQVTVALEYARLTEESLERARLRQELEVAAASLPDDIRDLFQDAYVLGARIHSNSWGHDAAGDYDLDAANADDFVWTNPDFTITTSAGNAGEDLDADGIVDPDTIGSPATSTD